MTPAVEAVTVPPVDVYVRPATLKGLPKEVILYQYEVCPFCCKVKAFLDYNQVKFPPTCNEINCAEVVYNVQIVMVAAGCADTIQNCGGQSLV